MYWIFLSNISVIVQRHATYLDLRKDSHNHTQDDSQKKVPSACKFLEHSPENHQESDLKCDWQGWPVQKFYTFPSYLPSQKIDESTHLAFLELLTAANESEAWEALRKLGCVKEDDNFADGKRLDLPTFRALFSSLCGVFLLDTTKYGCKALCACRCFSLIGACPHVYLVRYINNDSNIPALASMSELTVKDAPSLADADHSLRETHRTGRAMGRPMKVPPQSAWSTMKDLRARLEQQKEIRKQARTEERTKVWQLFREGLGPGAAADAVPGGQERDIALTKCSKRLASQNFVSILEGLELLASLKATREEAHQLKLVHLVHAVQRHGDSRLISLMASRILRAWETH